MDFIQEHIMVLSLSLYALLGLVAIMRIRVLKKRLEYERGRADKAERNYAIDQRTGLISQDASTKVLRRQRQDLIRAYRNGKAEDIILFFIDIDDFKKLNDEHSYAFANEILSLIGARLKMLFRRPSDILFRYGGDEIGIAVKVEGHAEDMSREVKRHLSALHKELGFSLPSPKTGEQVQVSVSVGFASFLDKESDKPVKLVMDVIHEASEDMKHNKKREKEKIKKKEQMAMLAHSPAWVSGSS